MLHETYDHTTRNLRIDSAILLLDTKQETPTNTEPLSVGLKIIFQAVVFAIPTVLVGCMCDFGSVKTADIDSSLTQRSRRPEHTRFMDNQNHIQWTIEMPQRLRFPEYADTRWQISWP